jgi:Ni/Fe-hydrogenase b-type cytochrome subunit
VTNESQPEAEEPKPDLPKQKPATEESATQESANLESAKLESRPGVLANQVGAGQVGASEAEAKKGEGLETAAGAPRVAPDVQEASPRARKEVRVGSLPEVQKKDVPPPTVLAAYEHPWVVRFTHWLNAASIFVLATSGLQIFRAFPSFGPKIPQHNFANVPKTFPLGGWLGGALQWHFTFMWIFVGYGVFYLMYQFLSGHYRTVLFTPRDIPGVWPMVRHYFLFGSKPAVTEQYNALQKLAYTATVMFGVLSTLTGLVLYKPVQFSWLASAMGGFHLARIWHFVAMCGFLAFIPGHLIMVVLHGWANFASMLVGWKRDPEYLRE